jgi:chromosome segregation ATPase
MTDIKPTGSEARVEFEQFVKRMATLFANALSAGDVSEDLNPFEVLIAYRDLFNRIDADGDGRIYPDQLHDLVRGLTRMESSGVSRSPDVTSTEMIVNHLDKAKKGYVDYVDFLAGALLSTEPPASSSSVEIRGNEDSEFMSAMGPGAAQHSSVFEDQLELDFKPNSAGARPSASVESQSSLSQMAAQTHLLEQRLSTAQSELDKSESSRADLLARLNEQDKQIDGYKKQLKAVSEMEQERHRISDEMEELRANLHTAKENLKSASKAESELKIERDRLREDLFQKGKEINDIEDQLRGFRDSANGAEDAKTQLAALQAQLAAQSERYDALVKAKAEQDASHAKVVEALHELQAKHEVTLLEVEDAKRRFLDLSDEKTAISTSQQSRQVKGSNLKAELTSAMRPMSPAKSGENLVSSSLPSSSYGVADSGSNASSGNADEILQLKIELDMLGKEKKALLAHLSAADAKTTVLEREKSEATAKVVTLTSDLTNAERAKASLQRQYDDVKSELDETKGMLEAAQAAVSSANAAAAKAAASAFSRPEATMTENELEELRLLRLSRRELDEQINKLKAQIDSDAYQIKALRNEVQTLRDLNRTLKARIAQIPEEPVALNPDEDMRRGLIGNGRVARHDQGCCDSCTIM